MPLPLAATACGLSWWYFWKKEISLVNTHAALAVKLQLQHFLTILALTFWPQHFGASQSWPESWYMYAAHAFMLLIQALHLT